jgi:hypothetical protein
MYGTGGPVIICLSTNQSKPASQPVLQMGTCPSVSPCLASEMKVAPRPGLSCHLPSASEGASPGANMLFCSIVHKQEGVG